MCYCSPYSFDTEEPSFSTNEANDVGHHELDDLIVGRESQRHYAKPVSPFPSKRPQPVDRQDDQPSEAGKTSHSWCD